MFNCWNSDLCFVSAIQKSSSTNHQVELDNLDSGTFENYCIKLFARNSFENVRSAKVDSNKGIDIIAEKSVYWSSFFVTLCLVNTYANRASIGALL